jgi:hypothetical protein
LTSASANAALIESAKQDVLRKLNDPDSARFSDLTAKESNGRHFVCGRVNAKNRFGGYDGFKPFLYDRGFLSDRLSTAAGALPMIQLANLPG